jgi:peptide-methionine (S)-S-oxide reductase
MCATATPGTPRWCASSTTRSASGSTSCSRSSSDVGPQYRSVIFHVDDAQRDAARAFVARLEADQVFDRPIVTQVVPLANYFAAEAYHQRYYERNPYQGYCMAVVGPKVAKFRRQFASRLKSRR